MCRWFGICGLLIIRGTLFWGVPPIRLVEFGICVGFPLFWETTIQGAGTVRVYGAGVEVFGSGFTAYGYKTLLEIKHND